MLIGGLAWRQVFLKPYYDSMESAQMLRCVLEPGPRGRILDRHGNVLVDNEARYSVVLYTNELRDEFDQEFYALKNQTAQLAYDSADARPTPNSATLYRDARFIVAQWYLRQANLILGRNDTLDRVTFDREADDNPLLPVTLIDHLTPQEYARFNAQTAVDIPDSKGIQRPNPMQTQVQAQRAYPNGSLAFNALGYVSRTAEAEGDTSSFADLWRQYLRIQPQDRLPQHITFTLPSWHGRIGLEYAYDQQLRGETGGEIWVVDPSAKMQERIAVKTPGKGADLQCSLDLNLQRTAENALAHPPPPAAAGPLIGSAVALDVRTGEVLVMAVSPTFDLNETVPSMSQEFADKLNGIVDGKADPHSTNSLNRATQGLYPAGSTFKLIDTIAGLRAGVLNGTMFLDCPASITFPPSQHIFNDDSRTDQGNIGLVKALQISNDVFFFQVGVNILKQPLITQEARRMGLGQPTGIGLGEHAGIIPDPAWKMANRHDSADSFGKWSDDDTANLAVGQGYVEVTPLQMACMVASIARDETRTQPTLIHNPNLDPATIQHGGEPLGLTPEERQLLLTGMEAVVGPGGTGYPAQIQGLRIAGKTGTAQWGPHKNTTVAWFVCFAPIENPQIAVAVAIESAVPGEDYYGGQIAGPVARAILNAYFHPAKKN